MMRRLAVHISIFLSFCGVALAQERDTVRTREVEVSANLLEGDVVNGERIRRLTGDVRLRQEETRLWARRAVQYLDRREILFTGDVLVVERGDTLRADTVLYNSRLKTGSASGRVRLSDGDVFVRAPSGLYFTREKRAQFTEGVTLIDSSAVLSSRGGEYWSDEKRAEFYGEVRLNEGRTHLESDSVTYFRETDVSIARGNVFIERLGEDDGENADTLSRTLLFSDRAYNDDKAQYSRIEGDPLLVRLRTDSTGADVDTLLIRAALLESSQEDSLQRLVAVDSVMIWQNDLAAVADSLVSERFSLSDGPTIEEVRLFDSPLAWFVTNQISGDSLTIKARDGSVDTLLVRGNAFVARRDSVIDRIHQIKGQHLLATFEDDSLKTLSIGPRAEAINFRTDEEDLRAGAVKMSADRINFLFEGDDLRRLSAISGTEGTYYSEDLMPDDLTLEGFRWLPELRPTKRSLLGDT
ncbi:MAG: OstA-like protein, partial [Rhodothermales bacterium]